MRPLFIRINSIFLKGLLTLLPIVITIYLLIWVVRSLEVTFGEALTTLMALTTPMPDDFYIPGLGLMLAILAILLTGVLVENYLAGSFFKRFEAFLKRAPVIRTIYSPLKDLTDLFSRNQGPDSSQKVVFVRVTPEIELLGLVMRDRFDDLHMNGSKTSASTASTTGLEEKIAVFVPFSYGFGGYTLLVDRTKVRDAGLSAERALQLAITGWARGR
jgi:uncharacterized membrane protein